MTGTEKKIDEIFLSKDKFSREIENFVMKNNCGYLEAITHMIIEKNIEFEKAGKYLTSTIIEKLEVEAQEINLVKKTKTSLPI